MAPEPDSRGIGGSFRVEYAHVNEIKSTTFLGNSDNIFTERELIDTFFMPTSYIRFDPGEKILSAGGIPGLILTSNMIETIRNYAKAVQGFPSNIRDNFIRMFYLSASTITTLGFGDIVPVTQLARILISLESILGITMMGLFLNALSNEMKK